MSSSHVSVATERFGDAAARIGIAAIFATSGAELMIDPGVRRVQLIRDAGLPHAALLARLAGLVMAASAVVTAVDRHARVAPLVLAATLAVITPVGHPLWKVRDTEERRQHRVHILKNVALFGALIGRASRPARRTARECGITHHTTTLSGRR